MIPAIQAITNLELPEDKKIELIRLLVSDKKPIPQVVLASEYAVPDSPDGAYGGVRTAQR